MADFSEMIQTQWWTVKIIKDKENKMDYNGWLEKNTTGFATVLESGRVIIFKGKGLPISFNSVDEAKEYATCITKCRNKAREVTDAWNDAMW